MWVLKELTFINLKSHFDYVSLTQMRSMKYFIQTPHAVRRLSVYENTRQPPSKQGLQIS